MKQEVTRKETGVHLWQYTGYLLIAVLVLSVLTLVLSSCEKEAMNVPGEKVQVKFSLKPSDYGQNETLTRSGSLSRVVETVSSPVNEDWTVEATLIAEESSTATTRAAFDAIVNGAKFRLLVYQGSSTVVATEELTYNLASPDLTSTLSLSPGSYTFVIYSYNTTSSPPYTAGSNAETVDTDNGHDLLYGSVDATIGSSSRVDIPVSHKFNRVRLSTFITAGSGTPPTLSHVSGLFVTNYNGTLTKYGGGNPNPAQGALGSAVPLTGSGLTGPGASLMGDYAIVFTGGTNPFTVNVTATVTGATSTTVTAIPVKFNAALVSGGSYTLQLNFHKVLKWAVSNIYWDPTLNGNKGALTFEPYGGDQSKAGYQGVFFKFGSLVGISPGGPANNVFSATSTFIYVYNNTTSQWEQKTLSGATPAGDYGLTNNNSWDGIPYVDVTTVSSSSMGRDINYVNTMTQVAGKGDVCKVISNNAYRIPAQQDFGNSASGYNWGGAANQSEPQGWYKGSGGFTTTSSTTDAFGRTDMSQLSTVGFALLYNTTPFPASGYRRTSNGLLVVVGEHGPYWSGSVIYTVGAGTLNFNSSTVFLHSIDDPTDALSVRCVKN